MMIDEDYTSNYARIELGKNRRLNVDSSDDESEEETSNLDSFNHTKRRRRARETPKSPEFYDADLVEDELDV